MRYYRVHTADIAYITQQPRGTFTAIGKLVDENILSEGKRQNIGKIVNILRRYYRFRHSMMRGIRIRRLPGLRIRLRAIVYILK